MRLVRATAVEASDTNEVARFIYNAIKEGAFIRIRDDETEMSIELNWWDEYQELDRLEMYYHKDGGVDWYSVFYDWIQWAHQLEEIPDDKEQVISLLKERIDTHIN